MSETTSVIIPCYWANQDLLDMTNTCINSLSGVDEVIVVDDGSPLEDITLPKDVTVLHKRENGGYASAVNAGLARAIGGILIIANNDVEFIDPYWLHHLTSPLEDGYDISSIRTTDTDGWVTQDKVTEGDKFGSLWAMRREVYETIGGLDESFGNYFEDLDYQKRAEDSGFRVAKNHAGLVSHIGKATFRVIDREDRAFQEARLKFIEKHGRVW